MTQTRWYCQTCAREWLANASAVGAIPWTPDQGCPGCASRAIETIAYTPSFPGGDIPRAGAPRVEETSRIRIVEGDAPAAVLLEQVRSNLDPTCDDFEGVPI